MGLTGEETLIPTTDTERMRPSFRGVWRRGGTQADIEAASEQFFTVNFSSLKVLLIALPLSKALMRTEW